VASSWKIGQDAIILLRSTLGPELCDELVPLAGSGVSLHKIKGSMHDTCNTANLVPHKVLEMRESSERLHTQNLPLVEWNREYERYIKDELGESIMEVQKAGVGRTRVEGSGILLLRAMRRLTHKGAFFSFA
jgi:hypothetical protein